MPVFLIGYRGTGKTTVGRCLAARLGCRAVDADEWLEHKAGRSIAEIFATGGEAAFRDLESEVVVELAGLDRAVVSLGGGAVMREQNRRAIVGRGKTVWLRANLDTIVARISADSTTAERRPNLTAAGGYDEVAALLASRSPVYRECADLAVDTEGKTPEQIADEVVALLGDWLPPVV